MSTDEGVSFWFNILGLITIHIGWKRKEDHAGVDCNLDFFGLMIHNQVYDTRHWNYAQNRWMTEADYLERDKQVRENLSREDGPL